MGQLKGTFKGTDLHKDILCKVSIHFGGPSL